MDKNREKLSEFLKKRFPNSVRLERHLDDIQELAESYEEDEAPPKAEKMRERHRQNGGRKVKGKIRK